MLCQIHCLVPSLELEETGNQREGLGLNDVV